MDTIAKKMFSYEQLNLPLMSINLTVVTVNPK